jgi:hypothetical protein
MPDFFWRNSRSLCLLAGNVTQAISIFGFAFYIQPIMMPLLLEMPKGKVGVKLISWSTRIVVLGT